MRACVCEEPAGLENDEEATLMFDEGYTEARSP